MNAPDELRLDRDTLAALGLDSYHVKTRDDDVVMDAAASAHFDALRARAAVAGFDLRIASGYRSYQRQLAIFDAKWLGSRRVLDDNDQPLARELCTDDAWLHCILRFSALPGTSRHHWGTDIDIFDANALSRGEQLRLTPSEYAPSGVFADLSVWLDDVLTRDDAEGFYRPYDTDLGGVSREPWHLSYRPRATLFADRVTADTLLKLWAATPNLRPKSYGVLVDRLEDVLARYVV